MKPILSLDALLMKPILSLDAVLMKPILSLDALLIKPIWSLDFLRETLYLRGPTGYCAKFIRVYFHFHIFILL